MTWETGGTQNTIKNIRESLDITLSELALRTGITEQRIKQLETGNEQPSPEEASRIALALDILPDELMKIICEQPRTSLKTNLYAILETIDSNARRFISEKEIEQLEKALFLSVDAVQQLKRNR